MDRWIGRDWMCMDGSGRDLEISIRHGGWCLAIYLFGNSVHFNCRVELALHIKT